MDDQDIVVNADPESPEPLEPSEEQEANVEEAPELTDEERAQIHDRNAQIRAMDAALTDMRQRSYEGKLTTPSRWKKMSFAPTDMAAEDFEELLLSYIEDHDHAEDSPAIGEMAAPKPLDVILEGKELDEDDPLPELDVSDVVLLYGKKGTYLYSKPLMSHSFAHALFLTTENDDIATFVDVVRTESKVYPRPVSIDTFLNPPYLWPLDKTRKVFNQAVQDGAFKDLGEVAASNGVTCFYSNLYLSEAQAKSLAEWYEVEKPNNP